MVRDAVYFQLLQVVCNVIDLLCNHKDAGYYYTPLLTAYIFAIVWMCSKLSYATYDYSWYT